MSGSPNIVEFTEYIGRVLQLTEAEKNSVDLPIEDEGESDDSNGRKIVAKLLLSREISLETLRSAIVRAWAIVGRLECKIVGRNLFIFKLQNCQDMVKVLDGGPWNYDNNLLILMRFDASKGLSDYSFDKLPIWIQCKHLPMRKLPIETVIQLGSMAGKVAHTDVDDFNDGWDGCLRIRVEIDITKPLARGSFLNIQDSGEKWIAFAYERIPKFCFRCGVIGHRFAECKKEPVWRFDVERGATESFQYGMWMKAFPVKKHSSGFVQQRDSIPPTQFPNNDYGAPKNPWTSANYGSMSSNKSANSNEHVLGMQEINLVVDLPMFDTEHSNAPTFGGKVETKRQLQVMKPTSVPSTSKGNNNQAPNMKSPLVSGEEYLSLEGRTDKRVQIRAKVSPGSLMARKGMSGFRADVSPNSLDLTTHEGNNGIRNLTTSVAVQKVTQVEEVVQQVSVMLWTLWDNRNCRVFGKPHKSTFILFHSALTLLNEFLNTSSCSVQMSTRVGERKRTKWQAPPFGRLKV